MSDQHDDLDTSDDSRFTTASAAAVGVGVLVAMALVAVLGYLAYDAQSDDVVADAGRVTTPTTMVPSEPEPAEPQPTEPAGADSPLVGLTETEVRERYPLVRVVQVDGEVLPATMDLQPGRISLALEGDTVVGATVEGCEEASAQDATWLQQACEPDPANDGPDANGKLLADADGGFTLEVGTEGDQYYQGMAVVADPDLTRVVDTNGTPLSAEDLQPDDVVWIWTAGACAESSPVQCDIDAIVVDRPAG